MTTRKASIISIYILTAIFCFFIFIYEKVSLKQNKNDLQQHVTIVANALWNMDSVTPVEYFRLAIQHNNYEQLTIRELDNKVFLEFEGKKRSFLDSFFIKSKLIPLISLSTPIEYSGTTIGKLDIVYRHTAIYTYIYILILFTFIGLAIEGYLRTISAKQSFEQQVKERTKELAETNKALKESEQSILEYTDAMNTFNARLSLDGRIEWTNLSAALTTNVSREMLCGKFFKDISWWNHSEEPQQILTAAINDAASGKRATFEAKIRIFDEEYIFVTMTIHPVFDELGKPKYLIAEGQNITPLKNTEQALRASQTNLQITLNSIGDAVIATDIAGNVIQMNPVAEKLTGFSLTEAEGLPLQDIFKIADQNSGQILKDPVQQIIQHGKIIKKDKTSTSVLINKDGNEYLIAERGTPIRDNDDQTVGVVLVFRDITEQYKTEEKLRQSQKMDSIGMLAGGVAHDFNNMLAGILGYSQLLTMKLDDDKLKEFANHITTTANRAADLTSKLLAFSRKGKIQSTSINAHAIIKETTSLLERSIDKKIELKINLNAKNNYIVGDPTEIQNAIINLAVNARDAMPEGGTLEISTQDSILSEDFCRANIATIEPGQYLEICVRDDGIGMDQNIQKNIFEPFFTTKETGKGTGLGLAAVYGTVTQHLGCIDVYSEKGKGTAFYIYIPISDDQSETVTDEKAEIKSSQQGSILVVDDEDIVRSMAYDLLTDMGYDVLLAEDGEQGVITYKNQHSSIDLVILDLIMPKLSGQECFRKMREINPDVRIVLSSGFTQTSTIEALKAEGVHGFIKKPYTFGELTSTIQTALAKK